MLNKKTSFNKNEMVLLDMDSLVPKDHLVRKIHQSINFDFIYPLVQDLYSEDFGRPSIDPVVLFKIIFIQYLFGIKSMRQTVREIEVNVAYRWFLGYSFTESIPHFSTFGKNYMRRFKDTDLFYQIFHSILNQVSEKGFLNKEVLFLDSTHIKAYANKRKIEEKIVKESFNSYTMALHSELNKVRFEEGHKPIVFEKEKKEIVSKTDKDCGMFHKGEKERQFAYQAQTACDKYGWVTEVEVYSGNQNDNHSGLEFIGKRLLKSAETKTIVMDAGYNNPLLLNEIIKEGKLPLIPYLRPKGNKRINESEYFYSKICYVFDKINNRYKCPMGKYLEYKGMNSCGMLSYKSQPKDCMNCEFKKKCTNQRFKEIQRHLLENAKDYAREIRLSEYGKSLYPFRKTTIERCFAISKFNHCLGFTFLRGMKKNEDRCFVIFACLNLKKLANILWAKALFYIQKCLNNQKRSQ